MKGWFHMEDQLMVGVGIRDITPEVGGQLFGYRPDVYSTSVNDPLTVTAIALFQNNTKAVLISAAVCIINTALSDRIRKTVADEIDADARNILLSAFHTHSGPNTCGMYGWGDIDRDYCEKIFIPAIVAASVEAVQTLRPSRVGVASVPSKAGINRREYDADGNITFGQNPREPYDDNMTVVSFKDYNQKPVASIVHYGAHCTAAGMNTEISRDWAGVMIDRLSEESGAPVMFINGAEGDVGPRLSNGATVGDISYIYEIGGIAAADAIRAYHSIKEYKNASIQIVHGEISLPLTDRIPLETAERKLSEYENKDYNIYGRLARYYKAVIDSYKQNLPPQTSMKLQQTIIALGNIAFVPFPFEIFSEISLRMREHSRFAHTLCLGLTNGARGYLPSQTQLHLGGYEVEFFKSESIWPLSYNTDYNIVQENLRLMEGLKCIE